MSEPVKESVWQRFVNAIVSYLVDSIAVAILRNVGGFNLFVLRIIVKYGRRELIEEVRKIMENFDEAVKNSEATDKYNQVVNKPEETREERKDAEGDFLNS